MKKILATKSERPKHQQQQAYREVDRDVKKMMRRDKQKRLEDMATLAEDATYKGDHGTLYKITKQVSVSIYRGKAGKPKTKKKLNNLMLGQFYDFRASRCGLNRMKGNMSYHTPVVWVGLFFMWPDHLTRPFAAV
ncbi:ribosome-recycling factor, partial [Elysia marginata]